MPLLIAVLIGLNLPQLSFYSLAGIAFFISLFIQLFQKFDKEIPIKLLIIIVATLQWVIAPLFSYYVYDFSDFYYMVIPESEYMSYAVPGTIAYFLGINLNTSFKRDKLFQLRRRLVEKDNQKYMAKRGKFLFVLGLIIYIVNTALGGIGFAFFLLSKLMIVGAFYLYLAKEKGRFFYLAASLAPIFIAAGESSIFHDLLLWGGFLVIIIAFASRVGFIQKLLLVILIISSVGFIHLIKSEYRSSLEKVEVDKTELITSVVERKISETSEHRTYIQSFVDRLNQGWIIARVMSYVPNYEPYADGETVMEAIKASLLPRFIAPNKIESGGYYFERFTGWKLGGASMNLAILGEAYANFGRTGGVLFMFIIGLLFNYFFILFKKRAQEMPELLLWIPFLFLYVVKAEDDLVTLLNYFIKSVLVMLFIMYLINHVLKVGKQFQNQSNDERG